LAPELLSRFGIMSASLSKNGYGNPKCHESDAHCHDAHVEEKVAIRLGILLILLN